MRRIFAVGMVVWASSGFGKGEVGKKYDWGMVPKGAVIAHRGASYDAPEETEAAYYIARAWGADYLEADIQRTKDGTLICLHDSDLKRTTDVAVKFPNRVGDSVDKFTFAELKTLDAGSWFNAKYPERAKAAYVGQKILSLDELVDLAAADPSQKVGLYLETKEAKLFPGIEADIAKLLKAKGWFPHGQKRVQKNHARVIMQSFVPESLKLIQESMPGVPTLWLMWLDAGGMASTTPSAKKGPNESFAQYAAKLEVAKDEYVKWIKIAKNFGATGVGPSASLQNLGDQSYFNLIKPWMNKLAHDNGLFIHAYTVDDEVDMQLVAKNGVDGFFSNRPDKLLQFYGRPVKGTVDSILAQYKK
jgi:glycerophosphoryl diester phosphodiesterase